MRPLRKVAVFIETSRELGRGLLRGVTRYYRNNPNWSVYFQQQELGAALPRWVKSWRGDGILARVNDQRTAKALLSTGLPLIDLRGGTLELGLPAFGPSNKSIATSTFEHLVACGFERFGFVGEPTGCYVYDDMRRDQFVNLVQSRGHECHIFPTDSAKPVPKNWDAQQRELAKWLRRLPKPIGLMCCHDDRGQQVLDACRRAELRVPDEIGVVGVDNDEFLCRLAVPSLSSVDVGSDRIGYEAASLLDRMMNGEATFSEPVLFEPVGVIKRQSTDIVFCEDLQIGLAIRFIRQNACNNVSVTDVHRQVRLSRTLLNRRFKSIVGHSPKQEILRVQMEVAQKMLVNSPDNIQTVAYRCGFNEAWYFTAVFRKHTGLTPAAYRRKHK